MTGAACFVNIGGTWVGATDSPATESANDPAWRSDHPFPSSVPKNAQTGALYARIAQSHRATATSLTPKRHAAFRPTRTLIPRCQNDHPPTIAVFMRQVIAPGRAGRSPAVRCVRRQAASSRLNTGVCPHAGTCTACPGFAARGGVSAFAWSSRSGAYAPGVDKKKARALAGPGQIHTIGGGWRRRSGE